MKKSFLKQDFLGFKKSAVQKMGKIRILSIFEKEKIGIIFLFQGFFGIFPVPKF